MSRGGRSGWRRGLFAALAAALVLGALLPLPGRRAGERERVDGIGVAAAGETSPIRLAQRIRRGPTEEETPPPAPAAPEKPEPEKSELAKQGQADADRKSTGCVTCHTKTDSPSMHTATTVKLGCIDCHGGKVEVRAPEGVAAGSPSYEAAKKQAHVLPRNTEVWRTSANPDALLHGDLAGEPGVRPLRQPGRPARRPAHVRPRRLPSHRGRPGREEHDDARPMLWGAALYNNGGVPVKRPLRRELQSRRPARSGVQTVPPPTAEETAKKGVLPFLDPLPRFEMSQPGNILRIFERGRRVRSRSASPTLNEPPGKPANRPQPPRPRHPEPHRSGLHRPAEDAPARPDAVPPRHQRPPRRLPLQRLHRLPRRSTPTTARRSTRRPYAAVRQPRPDGVGRPDDPEGRAGPSDRAPVHATRSRPASASSATSTPAPTSRNSYLGYMWWDEETDGELMYPAQEQQAHRRRRCADIAARQPGGRRAARPLVRPAVPRQT